MSDIEITNKKTEEIAKEISETAPEGVDFESLKEMAEAGLMYGHKKPEPSPNSNRIFL